MYDDQQNRPRRNEYYVDLPGDGHLAEGTWRAWRETREETSLSFDADGVGDDGVGALVRVRDDPALRFHVERLANRYGTRYYLLRAEDEGDEAAAVAAEGEVEAHLAQAMGGLNVNAPDWEPPAPVPGGGRYTIPARR